MNENLSEYILRQQRGYEPLPLTPGITPEQLNSFSGKNRTSKRNLCPVCGNNHGCQILDDDAVNCLRTKEHNVPPGWKVAKDLGGLGSTVVREREQTEEEKQQQREQWQRQQEERKIREQERKAVALTDEQIDTEARKIFKQLGLTTNHRQSLRDRGLTDEQIDLIGSVSVDRYQELKLISVNPNFPGMGDKGSLTNSGKGFLIPVCNINGQITGVQYARDDRNPKYQWFFGSSERRVSGELPLQFLKVNDSKELNVIEGTLKPLVAAYLHNINVIGDGGCRWASSPNELQKIIDSNQFDSYILNPDTGSLLNDNVMGGYTAFYLFLKSRGITLYVRDWGQGDRPKSDKLDVDEINSETFNSAEIKTFEEWVGMDAITTPNAIINQDENVLPLWNQGAISEYLADKYRENLAWNIEAQEWYRYGAQYNGIWSVEPIECIKQVINAELKRLVAIYNQAISNPEQFKKISYQLISSIEKLMVCELGQKKWDFDNKELIPFKNGVLNFKTHKFTEHCPGNRLTWCLPYDYNLMADCQPIKDWMLEMFGSPEMVEFVRAYLNAIVTSRTDLQSYLELIGPGGTGKSTVIRLAQALVGVQNCHTTSLEKLEKDKFEPANIYGKKLIIISDSERYGGGVSMLKAITGGDSIPFEMKFKQARGGFTPSTMVLVAANELPQSNDYTSGLSRRRLTVTMNKQIDVLNRRDLIEINGESVKGDFAPYIPGLVNWVLAVATDHVTNTIKGYSTLATVKASKAEILTETNPIAAWVNYCIIYEESSKTYVGAAMPDKSPDSPSKYLNISQWLYASYRNFSESHGSKPISSNRFSSLLHDLLKNQLKLDIYKGRDRNGSYFENIRIRSESDDTPPLISSVTASVTGVTASVTAETLTSVECDGCDGFLEKLPDNSLSSPIEKNQIDNNVDKGKTHQNPSQPSQTQQNQAIEPSQDPSQTRHTHHKPVTDPSQGSEPTQTPQIGIIYLDPQGFPHKIVERDDSGRWRDQHGDNITPGVFRTYKAWTKQEGQKLLEDIREAVTKLEAGNNKLIENLLNHAPTKAQMNMSKTKIKSFIGDDKFSLLQNYSKSRKV